MDLLPTFFAGLFMLVGSNAVTIDPLDFYLLACWGVAMYVLAAVIQQFEEDTHE